MSASYQRLHDSTPMLSADSIADLDVADVMGPEGHLMLSPEQSGVQSPYTAMGSPVDREQPLDGTPLRASRSRGSSHRRGKQQRQSTRQSNRTGASANTVSAPEVPVKQGKFSLMVRRIWHFLADALFAVCLMASVCLRVNVVSVIYLLVLCYGVVQSFDSVLVTLLTMLVSALACVGQAVVMAMYPDEDDTWSGERAVGIIGFQHLDSTMDWVAYVGVDALVFLCSLVHYFYVLRRRRLHAHQGFDFFQAGVNMLHHQATIHTRKQSLIRGVEVLCSLLLLLTAVSVPAGVTAVYYLILLQRLIAWSLYSKRVTVDEFVRHDIQNEFFLGSFVTSMLLVWSFTVMLAWYALHLGDVESNSVVQDVMKYAGFANFQDGAVDWSYYAFAITQFLFYVCCSKLFNLHRSLEKDAAVLEASMQSESVRQQKAGQMPREVPALRMQSPSTRPAAPELHKLLREQPLHTRVFLGDGGSLLACVAAIVWCVSYPSYASSVMMAWAFMTIGCFGVIPTLPLVGVLIALGTALALMEYAVNMTVDFISEDYTPYGLREFEYPFLDLAAHNICLILIYSSVRTRWRYQDILAASKVATPQQNHGELGMLSESERTSMESFRAIADLRKEVHATWKTALPLWLRDAKQVVFTHMDAFVLVTILAVALSARVSFIQTGYMVLAVLLILFFEQRRKLWRVLLVYSLLACLAVFIRNVDCPGREDQLELIGLSCYAPNAYTWGALWPTLFSAQLAIIFQVVFQLVIYESNADTIEERMRTMKQSHQNPIFFISRLAVEIDNVYRVIGCVVCYVSMLVVAFNFEIDDTRTHTTVIGCVHLGVFFILLGGHLGKFKSAPRTSLRLKLLWMFALSVQVVILVMRYVFQFDEVSDYLESKVFTSNFFAARDFGLENRSTQSSLSSIFFYLLPTAVVMALSFWQLASLMRDVRIYDTLAPGRSRFMDQLLFVIDTARQVVIAFSTSCVVLVTMSVAINKIDAVGAAYVIVLVLGRPLSSWKKLWFPLFWVSTISMLASYAYQLRTFENDKSGDGHWQVDIGANDKWFGLTRLSNGTNTSDDNSGTSTSMWKIEGGPMLVILMCFLQRLAQYFEAADKSHNVPLGTQLNVADLRFSNLRGASLSQDSPESNRQSPTNTIDGLGDGMVFPRQESFVGGDEDHGFFSSMRAFCIEYATHASVNVVMLLLMVAAFSHRDFISVIYVLVVYAMMYAQPATVCRRWYMLAVVLSIVIVGEYGLLIWLPPFSGVDKEDTEPWKSLSASKLQWLGLDDQHKWALLADFVALLATYLLPQSNRLKSNDRSIEISVQHPVNKGNGVGSPADTQSSSFDVDGKISGESAYVESHYIQLTRKYAWYYLEYLVLMVWMPITLIVVFLCGAGNGGIISLVYIGASVFMLFRLEESRMPGNPWIHLLRKWNWVHLFLLLIANAPFIHDFLLECRVGEVDASTGDTCLTIANTLGIETDIIPYGMIAVFMMISIQCEMFTTPTYHEVYRYFASEKHRAVSRRDEIVRAFYRQRTVRWFAMKKEKGLAVQRLKIIVSKLVHKVEELMDIAMGLHYNLPPMAPSRPRIRESTQNSVTIEWDAPEKTIHKIRFYRITRQQYPSLTLLGDFADLVEVSGNKTSATIDGLRPGTSYQFKVAAVSRMGEGPFSMPSDPAPTYSLNFKGTCTAGWMKYRRENVTTRWWSAIFSWMGPKFLHRYVVLDTRRLTFYRDEELALRHRSKSRRKKIKTSFPWKNVETVRLSDTKVQFDDVSPLLYCFEFYVHQEGTHGNIKYIFQVEATKDFNHFLSTIAFSVPRHTIDDSIVDCLRERQLPTPFDEVDEDESVGNDNGDEDASELSSVTGDESSFGDPEDAEFDEDAKRWFAWRIPLYRFLFKGQDAALQAETTVYDADDQVEPTWIEILTVLVNVVRSHSAEVCYITLIFCFALQADILNLVYVIATFGYLILESPRPPANAWVFLLQYTFVIMSLRYLFQLPVFCHGLNDNGYFYPSVQPYCGAPSNSVVLQGKAIQPIVLLGIYKFDGSILAGDSTSIFKGLQWDFYVALAILWHRRELVIRGLWTEAKTTVADGEDAANEDGVLTTSGHREWASEISSRDSIDDTFNFGASRFGRQPTRPADVLSPARSSGDSNSATTDREKEDAARDQRDEEGDALAEELLGELEAQEEEQNALAQSKRPASHSTAEEDLTEIELANNVQDDAINTESQQVEMEDVEDETERERSKRSFLDKKFPGAAVYYNNIISPPPLRWDKDIHAAILGGKPGRDFYAFSLSVLLLTSVYAVIFFKQLGEPEQTSSTPDADDVQLVQNSMVSGYVVLIVFVELCVVIWDRAAYVCGSVISKVVLQYLYTLLIHVSLWILLPRRTDVYFQQRPALVIFYLLHCVYMWLGALQIRYGYPVFRGSRYNYVADGSLATRIYETAFPLVMLAPFLFEMRALLDYVCTKTSLSWHHWVLLEDTAAHLYHVKLEMRERLERAEVLQGKKRQPLMGKLLSAGVMLLLLLACLIGPLALFSSANPSTTSNRITSTTIILGIEDADGNVNNLYSGVDGSSPDYEGPQITEGAAVQRVVYDTFSREVWGSSPPNVNRLVKQLNSKSKLSWAMIMSFERPGPTDHQSESVTYHVNITEEHRKALVPMIELSSNASEKVATPIRIDGIVPPMVQLTASSGVLRRSTAMRSVKITKHSLQGASWWAVEPIRGNEGDSASVAESKREYCTEDEPFCLITVSDNIVDGLSSIGIESYGITALYVFVLVTIGSAVKGFFRGAVFQIQYTELPDPEDVLELVEGIYIARGERYVGHLKDEVRIFETLVRVLRSPETLTKVTGVNVIHLPTAKEKVD